MNDAMKPLEPATAEPSPPPPRARRWSVWGPSLTRRMIGIASIWIGVLLLSGGLALDRVLTQAITRNFDGQLEYALTAM
ncbi:MAG: histidine kinase, partial [Sphingomonadaceae bacterium]|nr:histidine kinase [Sphingomonadaceae bacterium]